MAALSESLVVVLKGAGTVVTDGRRYYINTTGNPGMATGGTGDVLTGVIAALLAQKLAPFEAAQLGVFIHGLAGDIARDQNGEIGLIAGDLVDALPTPSSMRCPIPIDDCDAMTARSRRFVARLPNSTRSTGDRCKKVAITGLCRRKLRRRIFCELHRIARSGSLRAAEKRRSSRLERAKEV